MPAETSKSNAIKQLQSILHCEKLVVFGDGKNDIDMFQLADESYAVENAHEDLKKCASGIIPSNIIDKQYQSKRNQKRPVMQIITGRF